MIGTRAPALVEVDQTVWVLDPSEPMRYRVTDGGRIKVRTVPGCWGPMITPDYPSSHEVSAPVYVEGAKPGDALAIKIRSIRQVSRATTSGTHEIDDKHHAGDPGTAAKCPSCGRVNPSTRLVGTGPGAIRCAECGTAVEPYRLACGYTMLFDDERRVGVTVPEEIAASIREDAEATIGLPTASQQYSVNLLATGSARPIATRVELMIGNIGTTPAVRIPSSRNAGDSAWRLVGQDLEHGLSEQDLALLTDGHMDINEVKEGAILLAPVRVEGGGLYIGDVHAMQGDGELAGHTTDVVADVEVEVHVIKNLGLPGPVLLPRSDDLPRLLRPLTRDEWRACQVLASSEGFELEPSVLPLEMVGTGKTINDATENALRRLADFTGWPYDEVRNRATVAGGVRIGRLAGVVQVGLRVTPAMARDWGLLDLFEAQYGPVLEALL